MKKKPDKREKRRGGTLLLSIVLVFCVLGTVVYAVSQKISREMSSAAIQNLSESLDLIQCTIEAILRNEAEFQMLIARELARAEDMESYIRTYERNQTMSKMSLILAGETEGLSNTGEVFTEADLDFSAGGTIMGLPVSKSYLNYMGTWAYTIKCPVERDGQEIGTLYAEYVYDTVDKSLPNGFYNQQATLYIMDAESERFVLKPKGMGMRSAGHLNLDDFYRANSIQDPGIQAEVARCLENGTDILFYHDIREVRALNYMWSVNGGTIFLVGYVPVEAIQQEGRTVNQNIFIVVAAMLVAFFVCIGLYYLNWRQQEKIRKERETERRHHSQQLAQALRAAQIASESKTTFLSNMSHDIRTPMNAVLGFTTLLAKDTENPVKVREYTKKIMASGQHLLSLINDILDVSKIESGKVVLNFEKFALNDVVSSIEAIIQPMAKAKGQAFHIEVTGLRHEYLVGDETRINQILLNLLSNAVKYTQEGGKIWFRIIGLKQRSSQYEHIRIEVEDNGYGMTPEFLETIFDAFTRAENSTTNKVQGTGLGMAITKSIVELMGGTIEVSSEVNKGSLFRVELELRIPEGQADQQFWRQRGISRILAADKDPDSREDIQTLMRETGVALETADSLEEVGRRLQTGEQVQLVLLDWDTLEPDRVQAVRQLRETLTDAVPILILVEPDREGVEEVLRLSRTGTLAKPFFVSALQEKVMELWTDTAEKSALEPEKDDSLEGMRFLAAEDNEINAEILVELLDLEGACCEVVENGLLAVERFQQAAQGEFDAILMDVQMPVMNGHDATRAIRALAREDAGRIPIIAMTANAFAEDEKAALDAGMDAHVAKPLDVELLKKVIQQCIR
ncbi:response regulator [Pseudoflavonifractor sp. 524-17]|uniref:hybrid sensor histidine kinase/response regulator n=1 Tax=Pseudoflavonifractor sp. 524-17 TaxID=2304577 RepID=UPI0013795F2E|nr:ATP-binding protein [Pseudoflavonifractor sp. 524-17]NCE65498.1 response regulator [Pseudoflavonifractor sp. 524-17]